MKLSKLVIMALALSSTALIAAPNNNNNNKSIAKQMQAHDARVSSGWIEVTKNPMGTSAFASFHTDMLDIDLISGTDLGLVYIDPSKQSSNGLAKGFYTLRLQENGSQIEGLLIDKSGNVVQRNEADVQLMPEGTENLANVETEVRITGNDVVAAAAHGRCWLSGAITGHGDCWITIIKKIE